MTSYRMSSATIAFDETVWPRCGVVLKESALIFNRDTETDLQEWPLSSVQQNGPRSWVARRTDGVLVTIVRSGGCGCR